MSSAKWRPFCLGLNELSAFDYCHESFHSCVNGHCLHWAGAYQPDNVNYAIQPTKKKKAIELHEERAPIKWVCFIFSNK